MPYQIINLNPYNKNSDSYMVINSKNKKIHSYNTTLDKAKKQIRLLSSLE